VGRNAHPRMARLRNVSSNPDRPIIAAKIYEGPKGELGKTVHIPIAKSDIGVLRALLDRLEAAE
jgi:hypothetical protein